MLFRSNQEKIQQTIQKDTREIQKTFNKNLEKNPIQHIEKPLKKITDIPKQIQNAKPINPKPTINTLELENKIHVLINQQRTNNGLSSLTLDSKISDIARIHSKDMATRGFFDHENPEGMDPTDRGIEYGFRCEKVVGNLIYSGIGENIFQNNLYDRVWYTNGIPTSYEWNDMDELAQSTVNGWMESTGHRKNILTQIYDKEGIGVIVSSDDKVFITQDFC